MSTDFSIFPWEREEKPYFVNEEGIEYYIDKSTTDYAKNEDHFGTSLNAICFYVRKDGEFATRILMDIKDSSVLLEEKSLEGMGTKIDVLKALKRYDEKEGKGPQV